MNFFLFQCFRKSPAGIVRNFQLDNRELQCVLSDDANMLDLEDW